MLGDTIGRRYTLTIALTLVAMIALNLLFVQAAGVWASPTISETGLPQRVGDMLRVLNAAPASIRMRLATVAGDDRIKMNWFAADAPVAVMLDLATNLTRARADLHRLVDAPGRELLFFDAADAPDLSHRLPYDPARYPDAKFLAAKLDDRSWVTFTALRRSWGLTHPQKLAVEIVFLLLSAAAVSSFATRRLARPIEEFAAAARRFGSDPHAPPLAASGPRELRAAIDAFNDMQTQIRRFVSDRTMLLAAISHDLRTPLTRMRLRGEFIEDEEQQRRMFRDVDSMGEIVDSALAFFRDDTREETATSLDLVALLRTVADAYTDEGLSVSYAGPDHAILLGRPTALERVFTNLIDNATKWGSVVTVELERRPGLLVATVRDDGPGIPADALERVFTPFFRVDASRNRATGGVGLGLASARSIARAHGGEIELRNRAGGGLDAVVHFPVGAAGTA